MTLSSGTLKTAGNLEPIQKRKVIWHHHSGNYWKNWLGLLKKGQRIDQNCLQRCEMPRLFQSLARQRFLENNFLHNSEKNNEFPDKQTFQDYLVIV